MEHAMMHEVHHHIVVLSNLKEALKKGLLGAAKSQATTEVHQHNSSSS